MDYRAVVMQLTKEFTGNQNAIVIPRVFVNLCGGDMNAAALLNQILYWSARTDDPHGWFYKSYADWEQELGLSEYQVKRAVNGDKRNKNKQHQLSDLGVQTALRKAPNGAPTVHYRIEFDDFIKHFSTYLIPIPNIVQNEKQTLSGMNTEQSSETLNTEITTETTTEREEAPPPPQREMQSDAPPEPDSVQDVPLTPTIEKHLEEALDTPRKQHRVFIKAKEQYADGKFLDGGDMGMTFQKECNALFEEWREVTDEQNKLPLLTDEQLWEEQREEIKELAKHRAAPADLRGVLEAMYQKDFMARTAGFWRTGVPYIRVGVAAKYLQSWKAQKSATPKPAVPVPSYHRKVLGRDEFGELIYETPEGALP